MQLKLQTNLAKLGYLPVSHPIHNFLSYKMYFKLCSQSKEFSGTYINEFAHFARL